MSSQTFGGIDPGFEGALAIIGPDGPQVFDLPTLVVEGATKDHREYDLGALADLLEPLRALDHRLVAVEYVRGIPHQGERRQGATSIWMQGHGVGVIEGVLAGLRLPRQRVSPQRWRRAMHGSMGTDKEASRLLALQLFPELGVQLMRKKDHGRAEALLIAEWLRRTAG